MARGRDPRARGRAGGLAALRGASSGPDGVARERRGVVVSLAVEPYEDGRSFRTSEPIRASARTGSGCCGEYGVQPEPILVLAGRAARARGPRACARPARRRITGVAARRLRSGLARDRRFPHRRRPPSLRKRARARRGRPDHGVTRVDDGSRSARISDTPHVLRPPRPRRGGGRGGRRQRRRRPFTSRERSLERGLRQSPTGGDGPRSFAVPRTSSTSSWWIATGSTASGTRRRAPKPSRPSIAGKRTSRSCCARHGSTTCSRLRAGASACLRRARTSSRSPCRAFSSTRSSRDRLARHLPAVRRRHPRGARAPADEGRARARAATGTRRGRHHGDRSGRRGRRRRAASRRSGKTSSSSPRSSASAPSARAATRRVVVDPIDGSVNAKRGIPFFSFSLAVAEGATMGDVVFGYVYDFGTGEEWTAERGKGAFLQGKPLGAVVPKDRIEILSFEGTTTAAITEKVPRVLGLADRVRVMGSLALSLCHLADGRVDAACCLKEIRGGRHRRRAATPHRARPRGRALRRSASCSGAPRSRHSLAACGGRFARARRQRSQTRTSLGTLAP